MGSETPKLVIAAYGVTIEIAVDDPTLLPGVEAILPPGWEDGDPAKVTARFVVGSDGHVALDGEIVRTGVDEQPTLEALDSGIRSVVACNVPDRVFIHAGVVASEGRAIVLPGASWSGKTTLVAALVRAGATYLLRRVRGARFQRPGPSVSEAAFGAGAEDLRAGGRAGRGARQGRQRSRRGRGDRPDDLPQSGVKAPARNDRRGRVRPRLARDCYSSPTCGRSRGGSSGRD